MSSTVEKGQKEQRSASVSRRARGGQHAKVGREVTRAGVCRQPTESWRLCLCGGQYRSLGSHVPSPQEDLSSVSWAEVQARLLELQRNGGLCVQPRPLTELDVHHRILRYTNYQVALANKGLLPARCPLPWGGSAAFLSRGLALNVDLLLFRGPFSLFRGGWELPEAYKRSDLRGVLATRWRRTVLLLAAVNLALSPLVLAWQVLHAFYSHVELLRREPGAFGARRWSRLARLQLRHFNELPHELRARLARAYRPATAFLRAAEPPAPLRALLARQLVFFSGALLAALLVLTIYDEDVLAVEHVLTTMTVLGVTATVARLEGTHQGGDTGVCPFSDLGAGFLALTKPFCHHQRPAPHLHILLTVSLTPSCPPGPSFQRSNARVDLPSSCCRRPWHTCITSRRSLARRVLGPALTGRWRSCFNTKQ